MSKLSTATIKLRQTFSDLRTELISLQERRACQHQQILRLYGATTTDRQARYGHVTNTSRAGPGLSGGSKGAQDSEDEVLESNARLAMTPQKQRHDTSVVSSGNETDADMPSLAAVTPQSTPRVTPQPDSFMTSWCDGSPSSSPMSGELQKQAGPLPDLNSCWHPSKLRFALNGLRSSDDDPGPSQNSLETPTS